MVYSEQLCENVLIFESDDVGVYSFTSTLHITFPLIDNIFDSVLNTGVQP